MPISPVWLISSVASKILTKTTPEGPYRGHRPISLFSTNCTTPMANSVSCLWDSRSGGTRANPSKKSSQSTSSQSMPLCLGSFSLMAHEENGEIQGLGQLYQ